MNEKTKNFLRWGGTAGAIVAGISYIVITIVIVKGFESKLDIEKQILFALLGAIVGITISYLLREQGITFAKELPESITTMEKYNKLMNEYQDVKKLHTIAWHMFWATIKDIFIKGTMIGISTWLILYIFSEGNGDYSLFLLALSNITMFAGLGLWSMSKMYDVYIEKHLPAIEARIERLIAGQSYTLPERDQTGSIQLKE